MGSYILTTHFFTAYFQFYRCLSDVSTNLQNIQEAMTSLGNGNIKIELDHNDYHEYYILIRDTEKRVQFVFGEKAGTSVGSY